jgi:hypothetical protein
MTCTLLLLAVLTQAGAENTQVKTTSATPISVEPGKTVIIPPGRPAWVTDNVLAHKPGDEWVSVKGGPCENRAECEQELDAAVKRAADEYINFQCQAPFAAQLLNYDASELRRRLVSSSDVYGETIQVSFGPMEQLHAHVHFTDDFLADIQRRWHEIKAKLRLAQVGLIGAVVLGLLSTVFGFFKATNASRGQRGSVLQLAAGAMILVIVAAGVSAARYMYWL